MSSSQSQTKESSIHSSAATAAATAAPLRKFRSACDSCHYAKTKCCGSNPCSGCLRLGHQCVYSQSNRVGRPKGTKNKRSLDLSTGDKQYQQKNEKPTTINSNSSGRSKNRDDTASISLSAFNNDVPTPAPTLRRSSTQASTATSATPLAFDYTANTNFLNYGNMFSAPMVNDQDLSLEFLTSDNAMDSTGFDLPSDFGLDGLQYNMGMSMSPDMASIQGMNLFAQAKMPQPFMPNFGTNYMMGSEFKDHDNGIPIPMGGRSFASSMSGSPLMNEPVFRIPQYNSDMMMHETDNLSESSSPMQHPSSPSTAEANKCLCLQHHAKLLVRLKDLWRGNTPAPIDVVLNGVQQALIPWNHYIQCRICQLDEDQEVLILSAMSIRAVLRLLQSAYQGMSAKASASKREELQNKRRRMENPSQAKFAVGSYEVTGEERILVLEFLLSKTLSKIQFVLCHLRRRSSRQGSTTPPALSRGSLSSEGYEDAFNFDHLQGLLQGLEASVQLLSTDLSKRPSVSSSAGDVMA